jgi:hypothetical protein
VWKSFRNLGERVQIILTGELNTYDVLVNDSIVFSRSTLESLAGRFGAIAGSGAADADTDDTGTDDTDTDDASDDTDGGAE